jgi:hypothetical protein
MELPDWVTRLLFDLYLKNIAEDPKSDDTEHQLCDDFCRSYGCEQSEFFRKREE